MILIVDDNTTFRLAIAMLLAGEGYEVEAFADPYDVPLDELQEVACVITDYEMPGENGIQFADRVHSTYPDAHIVLVTANGSPQLRDEIQTRHEFMEMLDKPVDIDDLCAMLPAAMLSGERRVVA